MLLVVYVISCVMAELKNKKTIGRMGVAKTRNVALAPRDDPQGTSDHPWSEAEGSMGSIPDSE